MHAFWGYSLLTKKDGESYAETNIIGMLAGDGADKYESDDVLRVGKQSILRIFCWFSP